MPSWRNWNRGPKVFKPGVLMDPSAAGTLVENWYMAPDVLCARCGHRYMSHSGGCSGPCQDGYSCGVSCPGFVVTSEQFESHRGLR